MNQKEAVFQAISEVKKTSEFTGQVELDRGEREQVSRLLFERFKAGQINYAGDVPEDKRLTTYISGLVSNWLRKDERLNGKTKYRPKNPGIRAGSGDETMKAMKQLLSLTTDQKAREEIQREIDRRAAELKPKREVNVDALPEHLKKYAVQNNTRH